MSIEDTLRERITELSADVHGGPSLQRTLEKGRARRRRRTAARATSGVASVCAVGVVAVAAFTGAGPFADDGGKSRDAEWALVVPPEDVPAAVEQVVRDRLPDGTEITDMTVEVYSDEENSRGFPERLPRDEWDRAVSWKSEFELGSGELVRVDLTNSPEDDGTDSRVRAQCQNARDCDYSELDDGSPVTDVVEPLRRLEQARGMFDSGTWLSGIDPNKGDRDEIWYSRDVTVHLDGVYQVRVDDAVNVPTREQAESAWTMDLAMARDIATSEEFLDNPVDS